MNIFNIIIREKENAIEINEEIVKSFINDLNNHDVMVIGQSHGEKFYQGEEFLTYILQEKGKMLPKMVIAIENIPVCKKNNTPVCLVTPQKIEKYLNSVRPNLKGSKRKTFELIEAAKKQNIPLFFYDDSDTNVLDLTFGKLKQKLELSLEDTKTLNFKNGNQQATNHDRLHQVTVHQGNQCLSVRKFARIRNNKKIVDRICNTIGKECKVVMPIGIGHVFDFEVIGDYSLEKLFDKKNRTTANTVCVVDNKIPSNECVLSKKQDIAYLGDKQLNELIKPKSLSNLTDIRFKPPSNLPKYFKTNNPKKNNVNKQNPVFENKGGKNNHANKCIVM